MIVLSPKFWLAFLALVVVEVFTRKVLVGNKTIVLLSRLFKAFFIAMMLELTIGLFPGEVIVITLLITNLFYSVGGYNNK